MQRNGQNPIHAVKKFIKMSKKKGEAVNTETKSGDVIHHCPECNTEVPQKPGFRFSSLKCPKCGASMKK